MSSSEYEVVMIKDKRFNKSNCLVIVPTNYVTTNSQLQSFVRYLAPPHNSDDQDLINDFILNKALPPENWGSFKCEKKQSAKTFEEASTLAKPHQEKLLHLFNKPKTQRKRKRKTFQQFVSHQSSQETLIVPATSELMDNAERRLPETSDSSLKQLSFPDLNNSSIQLQNSSDNCSEVHNIHVDDSLMRSLLTVPKLEVNIGLADDNIKHIDDVSSREPVVNKETESLKMPDFNKEATFDKNFPSIESVLEEVPIKSIETVSVGTQVDLPIDVSNDIVSKADFIVFQNEISTCVKTNNQLLGKIYQNLRTIKSDVKISEETTTKFKNELNDLTNFIRSKDRNNSEKFVSINDIQNNVQTNIPINSELEFNTFNSLLDRNVSNIRQLLKQHLVKTINPNRDLLITMREILKKFFLKDPLIMYVAQKATGSAKNKKVFKDTAFYSCLEDAIIESWQNENMKINVSIILTTLGTVLGGVRDWERKTRPSENLSSH